VAEEWWRGVENCFLSIKVDSWGQAAAYELSRVPSVPACCSGSVSLCRQNEVPLGCVQTSAFLSVEAELHGPQSAVSKQKQR